MRIAVTYENGQIFQHFGHTPAFKLYDTAEGRITRTEVLDTAGSGHGALAGWLKERGVETLICGGIGAGARAALAEAGIALYGGASGGADEAIVAFLTGTLAFDADAQCAEHDGGGAHHCARAGGSCGGAS